MIRSYSAIFEKIEDEKIYGLSDHCERRRSYRGCEEDQPNPRRRKKNMNFKNSVFAVGISGAMVKCWTVSGATRVRGSRLYRYFQ